MRMNKERMYKTSYSISARSRNRTGTGELPQQDFKSCASTNSAIRAEEKERTKNLNKYKKIQGPRCPAGLQQAGLSGIYQFRLPLRQSGQRYSAINVHK